MKLKIAPPTPEQKAEVKENMVKWAKERLEDPNTLIVDVETTGLLTKDPNTEVVSLSMIDHKGNVVLAALVNPKRPIPLEAQKVHGIDDRAVKNSPPFQALGNLIAGLMEGRHLVCFNAGFDVHLLTVLMQRYNIELPNYEVSCAMEAYSAYVGEWAKSKNDWKWQKLPKLAYGRAHDALTDCMSTLLLLQKMSGDFSSEPNPDDIALDF